MGNQLRGAVRCLYSLRRRMAGQEQQREEDDECLYACGPRSASVTCKRTGGTVPRKTGKLVHLLFGELKMPRKKSFHQFRNTPLKRGINHIARFVEGRGKGIGEKLGLIDGMQV